MKIADKDGKEFDLPDSVWHHIRQNHPEIKLNHLKQTLRDPDVIVRSNWDEASQLYYKKDIIPIYFEDPFWKNHSPLGRGQGRSAAAVGFLRYGLLLPTPAPPRRGIFIILGWFH